MRKAAREHHPPLSAVAAILAMVRQHGWGAQEEAALKAASVDDFIRDLPQLSHEDLPVVFRRAMEWITNPASDEFSYLNRAGQLFLEACRSIVHANGGSRLAMIIRREFAAKNLVDKLSQPPPDGDHDVAHAG